MTKTVLLKLFLVLAVAVLGACAPKGRKPSHPKPPPRSQPAPVDIGGEEESPERDASNALIDEGERIFRSGLYDQAGALFQEAVSVDPGNGAGYYWLALARLKSGEYGEAEGLIEKALTLLSKRPEWAERLEEIQREFHRNAPPNIPKP